MVWFGGQYTTWGPKLSVKKINEGIVSIYAIGLKSSYLQKLSTSSHLEGEGERVMGLLSRSEALFVGEDTVYCKTTFSHPVIKADRWTPRNCA